MSDPELASILKEFRPISLLRHSLTRTRESQTQQESQFIEMNKMLRKMDGIRASIQRQQESLAAVSLENAKLQEQLDAAQEEEASSGQLASIEASLPVLVDSLSLREQWEEIKPLGEGHPQFGALEAAMTQCLQGEEDPELLAQLFRRRQMARSLQ